MATGEHDGLQMYLDEAPGARPFSDWIWGLSRWGKPVLVRAALAIAEPCLEAWRRGVPEDSYWQERFASSRLPEEALAALRAWLERGAAPGEPLLESHAGALRDLIDRADFYEYEASGSAELCRMRRRAADSGRAIRNALNAAVWTAERATEGVPDEAERQSMASAGPAPEVWDAIKAYRFALAETSEATARELIRGALRTR